MLSKTTNPPSSSISSSETSSVTDPSTDILNVFAAVRHLHPKQLTLLTYLNDQRNPHAPTHTFPLSYTHLHHHTGVTIEHIRRNGLHRLFASGLLSVAQQGFGGTIYRLHYDHHTLSLVLHKVSPRAPQAPLPQCIDSLSPQPVVTLQAELAIVEERLTLMKQLQESRQSLRRHEFLAQLTPYQHTWLTQQAKAQVDQQEGMRFIRDRFAHYEAQRTQLIDEWINRFDYGQPVPSSSSITPGSHHHDSYSERL